MAIDLDEYVPETMGEGDKVKPSDIIDHPLIVKVLDFRQGLTTKFNPDGDGEAVIVDVFDMSDEKIYLQVMWFNNAVKDNLKKKIGKVLPIRLVYQTSKGGGNQYIVPEGLTGEDMDTAKAWAASKPELFDEERVAREFGEYKTDTPEPSAQAPAFKAEAKKETPAAKPPAAKPPAKKPEANLPELTPASQVAATDDGDEEPPF